MRIVKENTMALMIDFQEKLVPAINNNESIVENAVKLLNGLKVLGCPALFTQQYTRGLGMTVKPLQETQDEFSYFDKTSFSCLDNEAICEAIEQFGKDTIIVTGMESHICVMQTVSDLLEKGYKVYIISDCIGSRTDFNKQNGLERMKQEGAVISSVESVLFEMTRRAGTPEFKEVSRIIK